MKNNVLGQVVRVQIDLSPVLPKLLVSINGTKFNWSENLTEEEGRQIRFAVARVTKGEVTPEGADDIFAELALVRDAVQRQVSEIEKIRGELAEKEQRAVGLEIEINNLTQALSNQKEVIDRLRGQVGAGVLVDPEFPSETLAEFPSETTIEASS